MWAVARFDAHQNPSTKSRPQPGESWAGVLRQASLSGLTSFGHAPPTRLASSGATNPTPAVTRQKLLLRFSHAPKRRTCGILSNLAHTRLERRLRRGWKKAAAYNSGTGRLFHALASWSYREPQPISGRLQDKSRTCSTAWALRLALMATASVANVKSADGTPFRHPS